MPDTGKRKLRTASARDAAPVAASKGRAGQKDAAWRLVYEELRSLIVGMKMPPGSPVREKEIALRFGVSRTPVREALLRLADEGLLEVFPQSGTFVARIPFDELPEAIMLRKVLEMEGVRQATGRLTKSAQLGLASIIEQQREAAAAGEREQFHCADEAFHARIAAISGYPGIWKLVLQVKTQVDRFRQLTLLMPQRMFVVIEDHQRILDRMSEGDPERAAAAMAAHLDAVLPALAEPQVQAERLSATLVAAAPDPAAGR